HTPEKISISTTKTWSDNDNQDGKRPESITINLLADGTKKDSKTVSAADSWSASFTDLPKYKDGEEIVYTITEDEVTDYTTTIDGYAITNSHTPATTSASVLINWDDNDDSESLRPSSVDVKLYKTVNGSTSLYDDNAITVSSDMSWTTTINDLPLYDDGSLITYSFVELGKDDSSPKAKDEKLDTNYLVSLYEQDGNNTTITNKYSPDLTSITISKVWDDSDLLNLGGYSRPTSINVDIYGKTESAEEYFVKTVSLDSKDVDSLDSNKWKLVVNDLPKYKDGKEVTYSIKERSIDGYTSLLDGFTITNTVKYVEEITTTDINIFKHDSNTNNNVGLIGAEFSLNGEGTYATDKDGKLNIKILTAGDYKIKETKAPEGYVLATTEYAFVAKKNFVSMTFDAENKQYVCKYNLSIESTETNYDSTSRTFDIGNAPQTKVVDVTILWDDNEDAKGVRPESVTVQLYKVVEGSADLIKVENKEVDYTNDNWNESFTSLPIVEDGKKITYVIHELDKDDKEIEVNDYYDDNYVWSKYEVTDNHTDITNKYSPDELSITVNKKWADDNNQDGLRPESISVQLYVDGIAAKGKILLLNNDNNWEGSFDNLPKKADGKVITYTVEETSVPEGYIDSYSTNTFEITNTHTPATTSATVVVDWDDNNNQDNVRPDEVSVKLYKTVDGKTEKYDENTIAVTNKDGWTKTVDNLPEYEDGKKITYTFVELDENKEKELDPVDIKELNDNYDLKSYDNETLNKTIITNIHEPVTKDIKVVIEWDDSDDQDGLRPDSVTVRLYKIVGDESSGFVGEPIIVSSENDWTYIKEDLPAYEDGKQIVYKFVELSDGKELVVEDHLDDNYDLKSYEYETKENTDISIITNNHESETVSLKVIKVWDDDNDSNGYRPESINVQLYLDDKAIEGKTIQLDASNNWTGTFTGLTKDNKYTVKEVDVPNRYIDRYSLNDNEITITNTYITKEKTSITVNKIWDDKNDNDGYRPDFVNVTLYADGLATLHTCILDANNNWIYTFEDLPVYDFDNELIKYSVVEDVVEHYDVTYKQDGTTISITNIHTPETKKASVTIIWNDGGDDTVTIPEEVTVKLYKTVDGETEFVGEPIIVKADEDWTKVVEDLPAYENGKEVTYSFTEFDENIENELLTPEDKFNDDFVLDSYNTNNDHTDIINIHNTDTTHITVNKIWNDNNDSDGIRPTSINVQLLADGEAHGEVITLSDNNHWSYTYTNLPKKNSENDIVYTIKEISEIEGYTTSYSDDTFTITNTHNPNEETSIKVTKLWNDDLDREGLRPNSVTVTLYKNGISTDNSVVLSKDNDWSHTFDKLDKYEDGVKNEYTILEEDIEAYTPNYYYGEDGNLIITNIHEPKTKDVKVIIEWDDHDDKDEVRPDEVIVIVYDGDEEYKKVVVTADEDGNWEHTFEDLPVVDRDGEPITYIVKEIDVYNNPTDVGDDYNEDYVVVDYEIKPDEDTTIITNKHVPEYKDVDVTIVWDDEDDKDGVRPEKVTVKLYEEKDDKLVPIKEVVITESDEWHYVFEDLPTKDEDGNEIKYVVKEISEDGEIAYTSDDYNDDYVVESYEILTDSTIITNKHTPSKPVPPKPTPTPYNPPKTGIE
ncbi:MAG: Cna B-type domain-containing protein, partial [Erysipelotrichaceae bacterium]|nr:Cna B-type domain-containing protein [Erysipelotrichaceae bacterium]